MRTKVVVLLLLVVVGSVAVTACGSSKSNSTSTPSSSSGGSSSTSTPSSSSGGGSTNSAAAQAAKQGCEAGIKNNPALAADKRSGLSVDCQKVADAAATGDKTKYKAAYGTFCNDLAAALPSVAQGPAKAACQQGANAIP
jgi:hypothetical protein